MLMEEEEGPKPCLSVVHDKNALLFHGIFSWLCLVFFLAPIAFLKFFFIIYKY